MSAYNVNSSNRRWPKILAITLLILLVLTIGAVVIVRNEYYKNLKPVSANQKSIVITIPTGATVREIGQLLNKEGLVRELWAFEWYVNSKNVRDRLQAGTYSLRPNQSVQEIVDILTQGRIDTDLVTILPGRRLDEVRDDLINSGMDVVAVDAALDPDQYSNHPALVDKPKEASLEGYLYPESFHKNAETDPKTIIAASLDQMQLHLTPELRTAFAKQGLSTHEAVTMASIVEREISHKDKQREVEDRAQVAQVYIKRLKSGMRLEADPTVSYAVGKQGKDLVGADYDSASPYNTYRVDGLPPGPISNASVSSLRAVAYPSNTDWLYFVSGDPNEKGESTTYFSKTLSEHEALTRQYCKKLCGGN